MANKIKILALNDLMTKSYIVILYSNSGRYSAISTQKLKSGWVTMKTRFIGCGKKVHRPAEENNLHKTFKLKGDHHTAHLCSGFIRDPRGQP